eukprot:2127758-Pleurochrysis_carterae.AAC.1
MYTVPWLADKCPSIVAATTIGATRANDARRHTALLVLWQGCGHDRLCTRRSAAALRLAERMRRGGAAPMPFASCERSAS